MQYWNQDGVYSLVSPDKKVVLDVRFFDDGEVMTRKTVLSEQREDWEARPIVRMEQRLWPVQDATA